VPLENSRPGLMPWGANEAAVWLIGSATAPVARPTSEPRPRCLDIILFPKPQESCSRYSTKD
jgi:hypothetical protein